MVLPLERASPLCSPTGGISLGAACGGRDQGEAKAGANQAPDQWDLQGTPGDDMGRLIEIHWKPCIESRSNQQFYSNFKQIYVNLIKIY